MRYILLLLSLLSTTVQAVVIIVAPSGGNYTTIQAAFNGENLNPGDIVEVQAATPGGTLTYNEGITPGADDSGDVLNDVILRERFGDTILLSGGDSITNGILLSNVSYFTVDGFAFDNYIGQIIRSKPSSLQTYITIKNCEVNIAFQNSPSGNANQGFNFHGNSLSVNRLKNVMLDNCTVTTDAGAFDEQTDGITSYFVDGLTVQNSTIYLRNYSTKVPYIHIDGIQTGSTRDITITKNIITMDRGGAQGEQGIYLEGVTAENFGTWTVINNVVTSLDGAGSRVVSIRPKTGSVITKVFNNTFSNNDPSKGLTFFAGGDNLFIQNNIFYTDATTCANYDSAVQTPSQIKNNLFYSPQTSIIQISGSLKTLAQAQQLGFDLNSISGDPLYTNPANRDFSITQNSPARDAGVNTSSEGVFDDIIGVSRPQGSAWDIGAYEYDTGAITPPDPLPIDAPAYSPSTFNFIESQSITLTTQVNGTTIYYTLDGSTPTTSSQVYTSPLIVSTTTTISALATRTGYLDSPVSSSLYDFGPFEVGVDYDNVVYSPRSVDFALRFTANFTAITNDVEFGFSSLPVALSTENTVLMRASQAGVIEAFDGTFWDSLNTLNYSTNVNYQIDLIVRWGTSTFDLIVTPESQAGIVIADGYNFQSTANTPLDLGNFSLDSSLVYIPPEDIPNDPGPGDPPSSSPPAEPDKLVAATLSTFSFITPPVIIPPDPVPPDPVAPATPTNFRSIPK